MADVHEGQLFEATEVDDIAVSEAGSGLRDT